MRHRRPAQCRQIDPVQRADRRRRRRRRRIIRSAPSSPMSATSRCPIRASTSWRKIAKSRQIIPTRLTFVDIAGLVRGASKGEGLGNQFLANIREVDAIAHVVRCFEDSDITHVEGKIAPLADIETIETELMLADLDSLEKRVDNLDQEGQGRRQGRQGDSSISSTAALVLLRDGKPARLARAQAGRGARVRHARPADVQARALRLQCRGRRSADKGNDFSETGRSRAPPEEGAVAVVISAQDRERDRDAAARGAATIFSKPLGLEEAGLNRLIRAGYRLLRSHHLFHRRPEGGARLDHRQRHQGPGGGRRHPHRFRKGLHSRRDHRL